jgi:lysozyme
MIDRSPNRARVAVGSLVLAASTLVGIALHEGYTDNAVIPVPGDVPTYGHGTTRHADGTPVKMGEKTNATRALVDLLRDASKFEQAVKRCAPVPMHPYEFQAYVSFTYNVGESAFCNSTLVKKLKTFDYEGACKELLKWDKVKGVTIKGLTVRREAEYRTCTGQGEGA